MEIYPPSEEFVRNAHVSGMDAYLELYRTAEQDPEGFWGGLAERDIHWFQKWNNVLDWNPPFAKWFVGGKTNVSYNCVDRHAHGPRANKPAIIFEGEPGDVRTLTYADLLHEVTRTAAMLRHLGVQKGDKVASEGLVMKGDGKMKGDGNMKGDGKKGDGKKGAGEKTDNKKGTGKNNDNKKGDGEEGRRQE